jgi:hypothetical protein
VFIQACPEACSRFPANITHRDQIQIVQHHAFRHRSHLQAEIPFDVRVSVRRQAERKRPPCDDKVVRITNEIYRRVFTSKRLETCSRWVLCLQESFQSIQCAVALLYETVELTLLRMRRGWM